jgi:hypothetical protein
METTGVGSGVPRRLFASQLSSSAGDTSEDVYNGPQFRSSRLTPQTSALTPTRERGDDDTSSTSIQVRSFGESSAENNEPPSWLRQHHLTSARIWSCGLLFALVCVAVIGFVYTVDRTMQTATLSALQSTGTAAMSCHDATWEDRNARQKPVDANTTDEMIRGGCSDLRPLWHGPLPCRLAIINAGMPRTGSTLVNMLVKEALTLLNFSHSDINRFL